MTFDSTIVGYLRYRTPEYLDTARRCLRVGDWIDLEDHWQTDRIALTTDLGPESTIDDTQRLLVLPPGIYQDLARVTTDLFVGAVEGQIVLTSVDQCFDGWIERPLPSAATIEPGEPEPVSDITCFALEEYAPSRGLGSVRLRDQEYAEWQSRVVETFHAEFDPDVESLLESVV